MKAIVLGSGIAGGLPAWNDGSEIALRARARDPNVPGRRGACLALSADGLRYSILDAPNHLPTTLASQSRFAPPVGTQAAPLDALVLTSADLDVCSGALALRSGLAARIHSPLDLRNALLAESVPFETLEAMWMGQAWDRAFFLDRDEILEARFFPLPGPIPDHLGERVEFDRPARTKAGRARCGVRVTDRRSGQRIVWAPRIGRLDSATLAELRAADIRFVDGTCYSDSEARRLRPGARCARDLGSTPIDGRNGSLSQLSGLGGRSIYLHIAATNPICDLASKETESVLRAGVEIAHDGFEISA